MLQVGNKYKHMKNLRRFFEYGYLIVGLLLFIEGIRKFNIEGEHNNAYLAFGLSVLAVFMYFFKKHFRKKLKIETIKTLKDNKISSFFY